MADQDNQLLLPQEIYSAHLKTIHAVKLSKREIDIIACVLNGRSAKGIGHFLSLSPRTVEAHIHNAMKKLGCTSRENLIALLEKTEQFLTLKSYYLSLLTYSAFEQSLKDIAKQKADANANRSCLIVYWQDNNPDFFQNLKTHLSLAGIATSLELRQQRPSFSQLTQETHQDIYTIYVMPELPGCAALAHPGKRKETLQPSSQATFCMDKVLFLLSQMATPEITLQDIADYPHINLADQKNYYFLVFSILTKILPSLDLTKIMAAFEEKHGMLNTSSESDRIYPEGKALAKEGGQIVSRLKKFLLNRKSGFLPSFLTNLLAALLVPVLLFTCQRHAADETGPTKADKAQHSLQASEHPTPQRVRSDLIVPAESLLLNRLAILQQIEDQFKEQKEDIKTVALVGIGGAGKTTLARQYARSQKQSATVWELNAVTPKSLKDSFEKMALALAESKMDQKILADLQKITPLAEREDQLLQFVKKNLKQRSNWILIYDQIDDLASAPKYFPKDANSWGEGRVILTTRDLNIENNKQINHVINIDELNPEEKFNLFVKIMSNGNEYTFSPAQQGAARKFLEEIPPFPLDVSIAAYYLRATETSYEKYLEHLNDYNQYVDLTQKNLLQGAGEYIKTRYKIISLTLNHLVQLHPDYGSLLFFISLLDAHNIPRGLLDAYKDDAIVDGFIYNLKKHSLITHESSHLPHARPTFSIHHNTQKTNRSYLVRALNLQKNSQLLQAIGCTLESFILGVVEREDISEMNILTKHCETFLSHKNLLPETITTSVRSALGYMYFYLGDYDKANQIIKMSLDSFDRFNIKNDSRAAQLLSYLGNIYRELGNYKKSEDFFKQSLTMYEKYAPEKHMEIVRATTYLGIVYRNLGNYEKAKNLFEKSLLIYQKHLPSNNMKCAGVLALLGNAYKNLGDYLKAKDLLEESLLIYKDNFPESHGFARALSFLAAAYRELGNYGKAKGLLEQALIIYKKNSLENHIDAAWALGILGNIYALLGNYPKAKELLEQSITIYRKFYPEDHVDIAWVSVHLGNVYRETSDYEKAKSFLERSLAIHQNVFGNDNIRTCWVSTQLGNVYKDLGDHTKAEQVLQTSLPVYEKHYGRDHLETARILRNLGQIYLLRNHMEAAERFTNRSLVIFQKNNHPQSYASLENLAELFLDKSINENNPQQAKIFKKQAIDYLTQALEVVKAHFPENSPHIARIQSKLLEL